MLNLEKISYKELNAKQQEIYNFQKASSVLADYGYVCIKLSDDWGGADFLAMHMNKDQSLKIQLKSRLTFAQKYEGKNIFIMFSEDRESWYLYNHDDLLNHNNFIKMKETNSYKQKGSYSVNKMSKNQKSLFDQTIAQTKNLSCFKK